MRKQVLASVIGILLVLSVFSVVVWQIKPVNANNVFSSGWENSGGTDVTDAGAWNTVERSTISTSIKHSGSYALNATPTGAWGWGTAQKTVAAVQTMVISAYVYITDFTNCTSQRFLFVWAPDSSQVVCDAGTADNTHWLIHGWGESGSWQSSATTINTGQWYNLTLVAHAHNAAGTEETGYYYLYVDNTLQVSKTGLTDNEYGSPTKGFVGAGDWGGATGIFWAYVDDIIIADTSLGGGDSTCPTFGSVNGNVTYAGNGTQISCSISDDVAVSGWKCATNNSGSIVNSSWYQQVGASIIALFNFTWEATVSDKVWIQFYANDTTNNGAYSSVTTFTLTSLTDTSPPTFGTITASTIFAGNVTQISCQISDNYVLSSWKCAWNNTGSHVNSSAYLESANTMTALFNGTWESTVGDYVSVQFWANDSSNNADYSSIATFMLTADVMLSGIYHIGRFSNGTYFKEYNGVYTLNTTSVSYLLNSAITSASSGFGNVLIYNGTSLQITETIVPKSNVYLKTNTGITIWEATPASLSASIAVVYTGSSTTNFTMDGGIWNANKSTLQDSWRTGTWNPNFYKYLGIAFYGGTHTDIKIANLTLEYVLGHGIDLLGTTNGWVYNCTLIHSGDNPITVEYQANANCTVEYCNVTGGQDVGINTFHAGNVTMRYNTVSSVQDFSGASHWGIACENDIGNNTILGNNVSSCDYNIVSVSDNITIRDNIINATVGYGQNSGIQLQGCYYNLVINNTMINTQYPMQTYSNTNTFYCRFINNTATGTSHGARCAISANHAIIQGGSIQSTQADGCISLRQALNVDILNVTFIGTNGVMDYGQVSQNLYIAFNDFSALTGTKVSLSSCINYTLYDNIGVADYPSFTVTITAPTTGTYTSGIIPVTLSSVGSVAIWYNVQNGTSWIYGTDLVYTVPTTMTGFVAGTYLFEAWANDTSNNIAYATVNFTVSLSGGIVQVTVNTWWGNWW